MRTAEPSVVAMDHVRSVARGGARKAVGGVTAPAGVNADGAETQMAST